MAASTSLTKSQLALRAQIAADTRWSTPGARDQHVDKRLAHFADLVDPDHKLAEPERTNLAKQRRRAHMRAMALASSKARKARAEVEAAADAS